MQLLPHEVSDVHPVLEMISRQDPKDLKVNNVKMLDRYSFCLYNNKLLVRFKNLTNDNSGFKLY